MLSTEFEARSGKIEKKNGQTMWAKTASEQLSRGCDNARRVQWLMLPRNHLYTHPPPPPPHTHTQKHMAHLGGVQVVVGDTLLQHQVCCKETPGTNHGQQFRQHKNLKPYTRLTWKRKQLSIRRTTVWIKVKRKKLWQSLPFARRWVNTTRDIHIQKRMAATPSHIKLISIAESIGKRIFNARNALHQHQRTVHREL